MCSTPKNQSSPAKPWRAISGISSELSTEQFRSLVERSNAAYERRLRRHAQKAASQPEPTAAKPQPTASQPAKHYPVLRYLLDLLKIRTTPRRDG